MPGVADFFGGGDAIRQILLWTVVGQLVAPILAPAEQELANLMWSRASVVPLSPAEAALGLIKNTITQQEAYTEAEKSGVGSWALDVMTKNTGEPISIQEALFLWRRGKIDQARLTHAIRQSRVRDEWVDAVIALGTQPIAAAEAVAAVVQNQIPYAEGEKLAYENGIDAAMFRILVDVHGRPPGPMELVEMARRGHIPVGGTGPGVLSLDQGISESDVKDKWIPVYHQLMEYLPPPRTVTALLHAGSIDQATALDLFRKAGLSPSLAAAYVANASHTKVQPEKALAKTTVVELYTAKLVDHAGAVGMLEKLGYTATESGFVLDLADLQHHLVNLRAAMTRVGNLYITRKIERAAASTDLDALGVDAAHRDEQLAIWDLERAANLKILSETAIAQAWKYSLIGDDEALSQMQGHGYTAHDAWIFLAIHNKGTGPGTMPARDATHGTL
ncbi:MAG TPA: hypothetical protein VHQ90_00120 [Thermoanaerobaculia bacterium]|nr:hypothetical protein [Thermoanaerobaculia bacterium]